MLWTWRRATVSGIPLLLVTLAQSLSFLAPSAWSLSFLASSAQSLSHLGWLLGGGVACFLLGAWWKCRSLFLGASWGAGYFLLVAALQGSAWFLLVVGCCERCWLLICSLRCLLFWRDAGFFCMLFFVLVVGAREVLACFVYFECWFLFDLFFNLSVKYTTTTNLICIHCFSTLLCMILEFPILA